MTDDLQEEAGQLARDFNQAIADRYGTRVRVGTVLEAVGILMTFYVSAMPRADRVETVDIFNKLLRALVDGKVGVQ